MQTLKALISKELKISYTLKINALMLRPQYFRAAPGSVRFRLLVHPIDSFPGMAASGHSGRPTVGPIRRQLEQRQGRRGKETPTCRPPSKALPISV
jgi:hypothetical protein